jgi:hypothetical protein
MAISDTDATVAEQLQSGDPDGYDGFWRLVYPEAVIPDRNNDATIDPLVDPPNTAIAGYWIVSDRLINSK